MDRELELANLRIAYPALNDDVLNRVLDIAFSPTNSPTTINNSVEADMLALALNTQIDNTNNLGWAILGEKISRFGWGALTEEASTAVRADIAEDRITQRLRNYRDIQYTGNDVEAINNRALQILGEVGGKARIIR
ncbi:MAG: hypothetical protein ACOYJ2_07810 [Rickettsiales bacterium]